jgi:hypothetical protein
MRELEWSRHHDGWRADPFFIEKLSPKFYVLSLRRSSRVDQVAGSSPSPAFLKYRAACIAQRRLLIKRSAARALVFVSLLVCLAAASVSSGSWAAPVLVLSAIGAPIAMVRLAGLWFSDASDSLGDLYQ